MINFVKDMGKTFRVSYVSFYRTGLRRAWAASAARFPALVWPTGSGEFRIHSSYIYRINNPLTTAIAKRLLWK